MKVSNKTAARVLEYQWPPNQNATTKELRNGCKK
jgi:hypothetical protein